MLPYTLNETRKMHIRFEIRRNKFSFLKILKKETFAIKLLRKITKNFYFFFCFIQRIFKCLKMLDCIAFRFNSFIQQCQLKISTLYRILEAIKESRIHTLKLAWERLWQRWNVCKNEVFEAYKSAGKYFIRCIHI